MMDPRDAGHDEVELGDLENDAFIPGDGAARRKGKANKIFRRWLPPRLLNFLEYLSRVKLMIILLITFLLGLVWLGSNCSVSLSVPSDSLFLSDELAKNLSDSKIPEYALKYAPLVVLDKGESFYPSDMAIHVANKHPEINFTAINDVPDPLTLDNLDALNELGGKEIFLTSTSSVVKIPNYLHGQAPNPKTLQTENSTSCAITVVEKEDDIVDAFYMYFYTLNAGPIVMGHEIGNHLGDWEHNMIRFEDGKPKAIWYSQHEYGEAFKWEAVKKIGKRPLVYSAKGSHANYAVKGAIDLHKLNEGVPANVAFDHTSRGSLWDPTLSAYYYIYSTKDSKFTPVTEETPVNYLYFQGRWGDEEYPNGAEGQESFQGFHKWTGGPHGPLFKHLDREDVCLPNRPKCVIKKSL